MLKEKAPGNFYVTKLSVYMVTHNQHSDFTVP